MKEKLVNKENIMNSPYWIIRPGGNDTALINGLVDDLSTRKKINDQVLSKYSNVEQVGFVNLDPINPELVMAGGEFCGNATRSTAWLVLDGKPGEIFIKVSGVQSKLRAGVDQEGNAWAQMPIYSDPNRMIQLDDGKTIVELEGITQVVINDQFQDQTEEELKITGLEILKKLNLDKSVPAAGVMFVSQKESAIYLRPIVWVRDIKTIFYETACGSGTTAVGLVEALKNNSSINISVIQPTGLPININVEFDGQSFTQACISGQIQLLKKEQFYE